MSNKNGKQLSISKFFARKTNVQGDSSNGDTEKNSLTVEVEFSSPLKRAGSFNSDEQSPKRYRINGSESSQESAKSDLSQTPGLNGSVNGSPTSKKVITSPRTKNKLNSFRFKGDTRVTENGSTDNLDIERLPPRNHKKFTIPKGAKLTPLESQVVAIKEKHPDTLLFVECGYKYRFFGEDAEIASKELNIVAHLDHNFQTASIPTHRLHVHVRRLVAKGYKVGVVKQTETAALKAVGVNKSAPFSREITALYTKATLIGEDVSHAGEEDASSVETESTTASLMVLSEYETDSKKEETGIAFVSIQPNTGEVFYDDFEDCSARTTLWGHLERIHPVEVIISDSVSEETQKVLNAITTRHDDCIRIERIPEDVFEYSKSFQSLCRLYEEKEERIRKLMDLPKPVVGCLGASLCYLKEFRLEKILRTCCDIVKTSSVLDYMKLPGPSLRNLELIVNGSDGGESASLFWVLNHTLTKFGARVLRSWILRPLLSVDRINDRLSMVSELMTSNALPIATVREVLQKLPDLEKSITTIFYKKCSPLEFWSTASSLQKVHRSLSSVCSYDLTAAIENSSLRRIFSTIVDKLSTVHAFADIVDEESAKTNEKTTMLKDWSEFEEVVEKQNDIKSLEKQLNDLRPSIARTLQLSSFNYSTVSGAEYLIEVKNKDMKFVPSGWNKISSTKTCSRFRSKDCERLFTKLQQSREQLNFECNQAWLKVLDKFSDHYQDYKDAVRSLGSLDALLSLAKVSQSNAFCRPEVVESDESFIHIVAGKHPIVQQLRGTEVFVANDTNLSSNGQRVMLVTGPNMGGKSCYMRQVALIVLMAQIGSFVPAESVRMSIFDAIFTRMGSTDEIFTGKSSLMVEMSETADIMDQVTNRSLVILDELGRGTSTHDGVALATAALDYFLNTVKCLTVFVTHYLTLCEFADSNPGVVGNHHMSFILHERTDDEDSVDVITFLYQLTSGDAGQSYGLNVARLASVPEPILKKASVMSKSLQTSTTSRKVSKNVFKEIFGQRHPTKDELALLLTN